MFQKTKCTPHRVVSRSRAVVAGMLVAGVLFTTGCARDQYAGIPMPGDGGSTTAPVSTGSGNTTAKDALDGDAKNPDTGVFDPSRVEVPESVVDGFTAEAVKELPVTVHSYTKGLDNNAQFQKAGVDWEAAEGPWKASVDGKMNPEVADWLFDQMASEHGSPLVATWTGSDDTQEVNGVTYTLEAGTEWLFDYSDPVIQTGEERDPGNESLAGSVTYEQGVRYYVPVVDEAGSKKWLSAGFVRVYVLTPGVSNPWVIVDLNGEFDKESGITVSDRQDAAASVKEG